jgi:tRNA modification GTPase
MDAALEATARTAALRDGITVAICGPPNVGKSTLFNALLGHERALTAPGPGTTRDYLTESLEAAGVKLTLVDTAGYREATDSVEASGVERAAQWARSADRVLWVTAADAQDASSSVGLAGATTIHVLTRCDLLPQWPAKDNGLIAVSGLTGQGIDALWQALLDTQPSEESALASLGARQAQAVNAARVALQSAVRALASGMPMDAASLDLYAALELLHGTFEQAERARVIEEVFSGFCVGK